MCWPSSWVRSGLHVKLGYIQSLTILTTLNQEFRKMSFLCLAISKEVMHETASLTWGWLQGNGLLGGCNQASKTIWEMIHFLTPLQTFYIQGLCLLWPSMQNNSCGHAINKDEEVKENKQVMDVVDEMMSHEVRLWGWVPLGMKTI